MINDKREGACFALIAYHLSLIVGRCVYIVAMDQFVVRTMAQHGGGCSVFSLDLRDLFGGVVRGRGRIRRSFVADRNYVSLAKCPSLPTTRWPADSFPGGRQPPVRKSSQRALPRLASGRSKAFPARQAAWRRSSVPTPSPARIRRKFPGDLPLVMITFHRRSSPVARLRVCWPCRLC